VHHSKETYLPKMNQIKPHETELTGKWVAEGGRVRGDAACEQINWLTQNWLVQVADSRDGGGWETLYRDPNDGRLWERTYPQGEMQGGGPPRLAFLTPEQAARKYDGVSVPNP
jgi:hypothetical protein